MHLVIRRVEPVVVATTTLGRFGAAVTGRAALHTLEALGTSA